MSEGSARRSARGGSQAGESAAEHTAFGPGKIIVIGEHAAVYGEPVLAGAINRGITARAVAGESAIEFSSSLSAQQGQALQRAFAAAVKAAQAPAVRVSVSSDLPVGMGLGSSAALSVAVARALLQAKGKGFGVPQVLELAAAMEGEFHGTPSGVDHTTSARGELVLYRKQGPTRAVKAKKKVRMVVAISGARTPTKTTVAGLRERRTRWPKRYARLFHEIGTLASEGARAVATGDLPALGDLMNINHGLLWAMQLSSERIDAMVRRLMALGALGAKLTGAGGDGGACIGLFKSPTQAVKQLTAEGVQCFETEL
ncbi:MAG: mevalonate kinase [Archangiaceae bacterium]|nr:mevalonate kinase [Archangiaceae bacterium]